MPSKELLDLRALLLHRHQWVRLRTQIQNALQAIALANGLRRGPGVWSYDGQAKIAFLPLPPHASLRRSALQAGYHQMEEEIEKLTMQVTEQAEHRSGAQLLMTHPGVGPVTALATDVFLGDPQRFVDGKSLDQLRRAHSAGTLQRETPAAGKNHQTRNPLLRFLWNEAGAHAARRDPELKRFYRRKLVQKGLGKARVAVARKLGFACGLCCATRSIMKSSVVVDRNKAVTPVQGCLERGWCESSPSG